jgi:ferritin-like metal-binding protein YciE
MSDNAPNIATLQQLLDHNAGTFTSAEIQLKKSLFRWIQNAASLQLKTVLQKYHDFIELHLQKMELFFEEENINSLSVANKVMQAFIADTDEKLSICTDTEVKDACLLASVQSINHFKISTYGTAAAFANTLGMEKQAAVFHEAEIKEKQIDDRLSQLAEYEVNNKARTPISLPG